ncbi:hypothetical protein AbHV_ORF85 [Abalone herpesvirus Victoria/AUS/2009]|uniref:Uncharacterized protein n=1 Tax=Abalone herpesvirus (isolate Abalone/Australia/Victoria/2009) TaxID=1241371 RepID=K4K8L4_ABHV|nr:hypothetical protein AbHV_ORF85 [Abalone herpesvirus Victoria/AUS/2009]AFU90097.1 hypothetical protein AbHV_ORF85 [Abalone herpesvirus Victoria/AUS/2009]
MERIMENSNDFILTREDAANYSRQIETRAARDDFIPVLLQIATRKPKKYGTPCYPPFVDPREMHVLCEKCFLLRSLRKL